MSGMSVTPNGGSAIPMTYTGPGQARRTAAGTTSYVNDALGVAPRVRPTTPATAAGPFSASRTRSVVAA